MDHAPNNDLKKVKKILIEYEDGSAKQAVGENADIIMRWWESCEGMAFVHGYRFQGQCLEEVKRRRQRVKRTKK